MAGFCGGGLPRSLSALWEADSLEGSPTTWETKTIVKFNIKSNLISAEEAEAVRGGVSADITYPSADNWNQWYDKLRFKATIDGPNSNSTHLWVGALISPFSNIAGQQYVSLPAPHQVGTFDRRVKWPYGQGGKFDLVLKQWDLSNSTWEYFFAEWSDAERFDQYLNWNVKVHDVWVHNTKDLFYETHMFPDQNDRVLDNDNPSTPHKNASKVDGVYGQCGALASNGINKTQWRHIKTDTIFAGIACTQLETLMGPKGSTCCNTIKNGLGNCPDLKACIELMFDQTDYVTNDAHVYIVDNLGCDFGGLHVRHQGRSFVAISDSSVGNDAKYTTRLAHEFGHAFGEGHVSSNCSAQNQPPQNHHNLMCPNGGRVLTGGQCNNIRLSSRYTDYN